MTAQQKPDPASRYHEAYAALAGAIPEAFWAEAARAIDWIKPADEVFDPDAGVYGRWFRRCRSATPATMPSTGMSTRGRGAAGGDRSTTARSPARKRRISYAELRDEVATLAAVLQDLGVDKGDRVILYMPMVPEAVFAMLACARIGAIHSVVFGGFAAKELATRIDDAKPKVDPVRLLRHRGSARRAPTSRSSTRRSLCRRTSPRPASSCSGRRPMPRCRQGATTTGREAVDAARRAGRQRGLRAGRSRPTRSTSSTPRARPAGPKASCATMAATWSRSNGRWGTIYGVEPGEVFWAASDVGWVVGHSYIVYAPLLHGCTTILYEGKPVGTPDAGAFWRVIAEHGVVDAVHRADRVPRDQEGGPEAQAARAATICRASARSSSPASGPIPTRCNGPRASSDVPVIDHWWQTETGWPIAGNPLGLGIAAGQARLADRADAGLRRARPRRGRPARAGRHDGLDRHQAAAAARLPADPLAGGRAFPGKLPRGLSRLLQHRRCGLHRRGRLRLHHGPHRRHHQRRRPPAVDRRHGGGPGLASGRRRMRRHRRRGRAQGRGALRLRGAEGRASTRPPTRSSASSSAWCARRSARSPPSSSPSRSAACRRRAPARSCAAR